MALLQIIPQTDAEIEDPLRSDATFDPDGPGLAGLHAGHLVEGAQDRAGAVDFVRGLLPVVVDDAVVDDEVVGPAFRRFLGRRCRFPGRFGIGCCRVRRGRG
jgi:hypothetical protein